MCMTKLTMAIILKIVSISISTVAEPGGNHSGPADKLLSSIIIIIIYVNGPTTHILPLHKFKTLTIQVLTLVSGTRT